jgi:hypothetical protein
MLFSYIFVFSYLIGAVYSQCQNYWAGTAPFCDGQCDSSHTAVATDNCGDGQCCWSGHKVYCQCKTTPTCSDFWDGTAPFCDGTCPNGFYVDGTSSSGNGAYVTSPCVSFSQFESTDANILDRSCVTGQKVLCVREGCRGPCTPGAVTMQCFPSPFSWFSFGILGLCSNGCSTWVCPCISFSGGGGDGGDPTGGCSCCGEEDCDCCAGCKYIIISAGPKLIFETS